jgi:hypothetical protein
VRFLGALLGGALAWLAFLIPDFRGFNQGRQVVEDTGWPATVTFALSTRDANTHAAADTYAGGFGEITGTGYARATQAEPAATGLGRKLFTVLSWATGSATDWTSPKSIVALDAGTSKIICAWNLIPGGAARDMSQANTTLNVTPDYSPTNPT